jgi:hypothetical protein
MRASEDEIAPFDDETMGGYVQYSSFIEPVRYLKGELKGLIVRYDPSRSQIGALTGTAEASA